MLVVHAAVQHDPRQVDGAEVAALVGQKWLLTAWICTFDVTQLWGGIVFVYAVDEDDAGIAVLPRQGDHAAEDLAGVELTDHVAGARVDERVLLVSLDGLHESVGDSDGDVEVVQPVVVLLGRDEIQDVRVIDPHDTHVGATAGAALFDGLGGGVEDAHEREWAAGDALGAHHHVVVRAYAREAEAGASAALVDEGRVLDRFEDGVHGIAHGQDEAVGKLAELATGVHERGAVGQELEAGHEIVEGGLPLFHGRGRVIEPLGLGDGFGDAAEHLFGRLEHLAVLAFLEIAALQHLECVGGEFDHGPTCFSHAPCSPLVTTALSGSVVVNASTSASMPGSGSASGSGSAPRSSRRVSSSWNSSMSSN